MADKWIGPRRVLRGDSNPPPDGYEYVRRYADDVRLAAGSGTTVENENVAGYVAFRRDWMRRHGLRAERCSLVDVTGDSMEPELFDGDSALVDHSRCDPVEGEIFALRTLKVVVKRLCFHDERCWRQRQRLIGERLTPSGWRRRDYAGWCGGAHDRRG